MHIDDDNVTTFGMLSLYQLGDVPVHDSSALFIHVLRKQFPKKKLLDREDIENHMDMYYTQEVYDYSKKEYLQVKYPWKFCTMDDFN